MASGDVLSLSKVWEKKSWTNRRSLCVFLWLYLQFESFQTLGEKVWDKQEVTMCFLWLYLQFAAWEVTATCKVIGRIVYVSPIGWLAAL